jgi:hypothetical protein
MRFEEHDVERPGRARIAATVLGSTSRDLELLTPVTGPPAPRHAVERRQRSRSRTVMFAAIGAFVLAGNIASGMVTSRKRWRPVLRMA